MSIGLASARRRRGLVHLLSLRHCQVKKRNLLTKLDVMEPPNRHTAQLIRCSLNRHGKAVYRSFYIEETASQPVYAPYCPCPRLEDGLVHFQTWKAGLQLFVNREIVQLRRFA